MDGIMRPTNIKQTPSPNYSGHGVAVGGLIGAIRNNTIGIAGIAGGDATVGNTGVAMATLKAGATSMNNDYVIEYDNIALIEGIKPIDISIEQQQGADIVNISAGIYNDINYAPNLNLLQVQQNEEYLKEMLHFANRREVTVSASRGGTVSNSIPKTTRIYPASYDDKWVLTTSGCGYDGNIGFRTSASNFTADVNCFYDNNVDISSPAFSGINTTLSASGGYMNLGGTSASAAYTTGVGALLLSYMNDPINNSNYSNLAPEDVERILELSADPSADDPGVDAKSGHGRLDAGMALKSVEKPWNTLYHFGTNASATNTNSLSYMPIATNVAISINEFYRNSITNVYYPRGAYKVNVYKVTDVMTYSINGNEQLLDKWPRHSGSNLLPLYDANNVLLPREEIMVNSITTTGASVYGYVYEVFDASGTNFLGWWPFDIANYQTQAKLEISLFGHDPNQPNELSENEAIKTNAKLYPNPVQDVYTIEYTSAKKESITLEVQDALGKRIEKVSFPARVGMNTIPLHAHALASGMYFVTLSNSASKLSMKFTKH